MKISQQKRFLTYQEQLEHLKLKKLTIENEESAIKALKEYSYFSLISGYKSIFKISKNGDYKEDASFNKIVLLYIFDEFLRDMFLRQIIKIETHIKSLYSYSFCELYGDKQSDYLNFNNYNNNKFHQRDIIEYLSILDKTLDKPQKYNYINYNMHEYGVVPLWIIIHTLTFGNMSKLFAFSQQKLQSKISKEFKDVYGDNLISMLNVLSKFRNVCAHGERLYNYKTQSSIKDLPIHKELKGYNPTSKNDLFNVLICFKYLSKYSDFMIFMDMLNYTIENTLKKLGESYMKQVLNEMGFPENWKDVEL